MNARSLALTVVLACLGCKGRIAETTPDQHIHIGPLQVGKQELVGNAWSGNYALERMVPLDGGAVVLVDLSWALTDARGGSISGSTGSVTIWRSGQEILGGTKWEVQKNDEAPQAFIVTLWAALDDKGQAWLIYERRSVEPKRRDRPMTR